MKQLTDSEDLTGKKVLIADREDDREYIIERSEVINGFTVYRLAGKPAVLFPRVLLKVVTR